MERGRDRERKKKREGKIDRERERERDLKTKFCTEQYLCDLFLPKEIFMKNFIPIDLKLNVQWQ